LAEAPEAIKELVEKFERNLPAYKNSGYKEEQLKQEFINPFFEALGWDVSNNSGAAPQYRDVIFEDTIKVGGGTKAPDYCFTLAGRRMFFVEAKKPSVDIKTDTHPAYQLRRYAWSGKLPLSILTDFEEFAVYESRTRPKKEDKSSTGRIMYLTFRDYVDRWDEIASVFSKDAVFQGSFDRFAESAKKKRGTAEVDDEFLHEIESWRDMLAKNMALRNPELSVRDLNYAVRKTIDRIIFLRMAEDRGIERYGELRKLLREDDIYTQLCNVYKRADEKYNSGLFHFKLEKGRPTIPDELTLGLKIDDKVLKKIISHLYYPDSPYEFSVLPPEILGNVYEQFLGKIIRLTPSHRAKVEEKPEVKKAHGVYYTPQYIVDYIVKNTVGKLCKGKTPNQISKLRILDPACGSGTFLLGAYTYLLQYHLDYYTNLKDLNRHKDVIYQGKGGEWFLTIKEKKRILLNNIYGVDIDHQAVEVTKLSLLLKVLEGESRDVFEQQQKLYRERVLPDLGNNIKCGNSLIGPEFYGGGIQTTLFDEEEMYRINAFDWSAEFKDIMDGGGFDAVIGNPPYVRPHNLEPHVKEYFWKNYTTFVKKSDIYCCFIEKAIKLLKRRGLFGYIVSNGWLRLDSFEKLRKFLLEKTSPYIIIDFTGNVFRGATVKTAILLFSKGKSRKRYVDVVTTEVTHELTKLEFKTLRTDLFEETYKSIFDLSIDENQEMVKRKMKKSGLPLGDLFDLSFGLKTGDDSKFLTHSRDSPEHKPLLRGANVGRYSSMFMGEYVWYVPTQMRAHRKTARPGTPDRFEQPKVLIRDTGDGLFGTFDNDNHYVKDVIIVSDRKKDANTLKYLTGILNSKLMRFYYETSFPTLHVQRNELAQLPIRTINFDDSADVERHDRMVALVQDMLDLHKKLAQAKSSHEKEMLKRRIDATDSQIDALVYELYGLTEEEIEIVKRSA
jgi:type I restriction-modification system DNA methylase subunit